VSKYTIKGKNVFQILSKRIEGDHIEREVRHIRMNKTVAYKPVVLPTADCRRIED
jgi:hypothetical protein